jgi:PKD repeat protein
MNANNGLGKVIDKNQIILEGIFEPGKITASRHANGRDWWIIIRKHNTNKYYKFLVSSNEINKINEESIGENIPSPGLGQAVFSPDGTKYALFHTISQIEGSYINIYDFDRCTGELSNPLQMHYSHDGGAGGIAISSNSRYLYVPSFIYLYQYDLWASDIEATKDTVAVWDGFLENDFFATTFYLAQLAPDNKIYINSNNGVSYLHVVNKPDLAGDSSEVCQHCIDLPSNNAFSLPNFPNYRLNFLEGSPCDTLRQSPTANWNYETNGLEINFQDSSFHDIRSWSWDFGDGDIDSIAHPIHEYEEAGEYEVCLVVENPRGIDTLCQLIEVSPSSNKEFIDKRFRLQAIPNPARNDVQIIWNKSIPSNSQIVLYNLLGQELLRNKLAPHQIQHTVDISDLSNGAYLIQLISVEEIIGSTKIIKQ